MTEQIKIDLSDIEALINMPAFKNKIFEIIKEFDEKETNNIVINRQRAIELLGISRYKFDRLKLERVNEKGNPLYRLSDIKKVKKIINEVY